MLLLFVYVLFKSEETFSKTLQLNMERAQTKWKIEGGYLKEIKKSFEKLEKKCLFQYGGMRK